MKSKANDYILQAIRSHIFADSEIYNIADMHVLGINGTRVTKRIPQIINSVPSTENSEIYTPCFSEIYIQDICFRMTKNGSVPLYFGINYKEHALKIQSI